MAMNGKGHKLKYIHVDSNWYKCEWRIGVHVECRFRFCIEIHVALSIELGDSN
jgi:hypothetical protein